MSCIAGLRGDKKTKSRAKRLLKRPVSYFKITSLIKSQIFVILHGMKISSVILSIYLLSLALLPCADGAEWCVFDLEKSLNIELHENQEHEHEDDCEDHCSPLCYCACCHITLRPPLSTELKAEIPLIRPFKPSSLTYSYTDLLLTHEIWQPPKS